MDQRLAVEAEVAGLRAFIVEAFRVGNVVVDAIEDIDAVFARGQHAGPDPRQHWCAARDLTRARFLGKVIEAEHEAGQPRLGVLRGRSDLAHVEDRGRRFDHRPDARAMIRMGAEHALRDPLQLLGFGYFRDQDRIRRRRHRGREVVGKPRCVEAIGADEYLARPEPAGLHGRHHLVARRGLGVGRDRVLQIEYDAVGRQRLGLLQCTGVGTRHIEDTAARTDGHACLLRSSNTSNTSRHASRMPRSRQ